MKELTFDETNMVSGGRRQPTPEELAAILAGPATPPSDPGPSASPPVELKHPVSCSATRTSGLQDGGSICQEAASFLKPLDLGGF